MLVSGVQQSDSVIHIRVSILFPILFPFRLLQNIEQSSLCYTQGSRSLQVIYFKYSSVYMSIPNSQSIPPPNPSSLVGVQVLMIKYMIIPQTMNYTSFIFVIVFILFLLPLSWAFCNSCFIFFSWIIISALISYFSNPGLTLQKQILH